MSEYIDVKGREITSILHIGDLVEFLVDGQFFQKQNGKDEKYAGYVSSLTHCVIGLSTTPHDNRRHGYSGLVEEQERKITEIEATHIKRYRLLSEPSH